MKPKIMFLSVLALLTFNGFSQSSPSVISTAGGTCTANGMALEWTLGETVSGSFTGESVLLTQGFEQPLVNLKNSFPVLTNSYKPIGVAVYPNPVNDVLNVATQSGINDRVVISLCDLKGNVLLTKLTGTGNHLQQIDMKKLPASVYIVRINNVFGKVLSTCKIVKVK